AGELPPRLDVVLRLDVLVQRQHEVGQDAVAVEVAHARLPGLGAVRAGQYRDVARHRGLRPFRRVVIRLSILGAQPLDADGLDQPGDALVDVHLRDGPGSRQSVTGGDDVVLAEDAGLLAEHYLPAAPEDQGDPRLPALIIQFL